jgi:hypothetical protein
VESLVSFAHPLLWVALRIPDRRCFPPNHRFLEVTVADATGGERYCFKERIIQEAVSLGVSSEAAWLARGRYVKEKYKRTVLFLISIVTAVKARKVT